MELDLQIPDAKDAETAREFVPNVEELLTDPELNACLEEYNSQKAAEGKDPIDRARLLLDPEYMNQIRFLPGTGHETSLPEMIKKILGNRLPEDLDENVKKIAETRLERVSKRINEKIAANNNLLRFSPEAWPEQLWTLENFPAALSCYIEKQKKELFSKKWGHEGYNSLYQSLSEIHAIALSKNFPDTDKISQAMLEFLDQQLADYEDTILLNNSINYEQFPEKIRPVAREKILEKINAQLDMILALPEEQLTTKSFQALDYIDWELGLFLRSNFNDASFPGEKKDQIIAKKETIDGLASDKYFESFAQGLSMVQNLSGLLFDVPTKFIEREDFLVKITDLIFTAHFEPIEDTRKLIHEYTDVRKNDSLKSVVDKIDDRIHEKILADIESQLQKNSDDLPDLLIILIRLSEAMGIADARFQNRYQELGDQLREKIHPLQAQKDNIDLTAMGTENLEKLLEGSPPDKQPIRLLLRERYHSEIKQAEARIEQIIANCLNHKPEDPDTMAWLVQLEKTSEKKYQNWFEPAVTHKLEVAIQRCRNTLNFFG